MDEATAEGLLGAADLTGVERGHVQALVNFYEVHCYHTDSLSRVRNDFL